MPFPRYRPRLWPAGSPSHTRSPGRLSTDASRGPAIRLAVPGSGEQYLFGGRSSFSSVRGPPATTRPTPRTRLIRPATETDPQRTPRRGSAAFPASRNQGVTRGREN